MEIQSPELVALAVKMWKVASAEQLLALWLLLMQRGLPLSRHFFPLCRKATFWAHGFPLAFGGGFFPLISSLTSLVSGHGGPSAS